MCPEWQVLLKAGTPSLQWSRVSWSTAAALIQMTPTHPPPLSYTPTYMP